MTVPLQLFECAVIQMNVYYSATTLLSTIVLCGTLWNIFRRSSTIGISILWPGLNFLVVKVDDELKLICWCLTDEKRQVICE